jgi:hypothetical protein
MGVCQCKEDLGNENQLITSRFSREGLGCEIEESTMTRQGLLPLPEIEQEHSSFNGDYNNLNNKYYHEKPFIECLKNGNDYAQSTRVEPYFIDLESEANYEEYCKKMFQIFTDLRKNPNNYINMCPNNLRPLIEKLSSSTPSVLCWSQSLFETLFDILKMPSIRKISDENIINLLLEKYQRISPYESYKFLLTSYYTKHNCSNMNVFFEILQQNLKISEKICFKNFTLCVFCSYPVNEFEDRVIVCLQKKTTGKPSRVNCPQ